MYIVVVIVLVVHVLVVGVVASLLSFNPCRCWRHGEIYIDVATTFNNIQQVHRAPFHFLLDMLMNHTGQVFHLASQTLS